MAEVKHKFMIISGKGGVGKTTVAVNLAYAFSKNSKVGILDADITGPNVPKMLGIEDRKLEADEAGIYPVEVEGIKVISIAFLLENESMPIIWRGPLRSNVIQQFIGDVRWESLDYLIVDLPPGTGDEALSIAQLIPKMDGAVVVTTPQEVALLDAKKAINFAYKLNVPVLGIIENMSGFECPYCHHNIELFKVGGGERAAKEMGIPFLGKVPFHVEVVKSGDSGKAFLVEYGDTEVGKSFKKIVENLEVRIKDEGV